LFEARGGGLIQVNEEWMKETAVYIV